MTLALLLTAASGAWAEETPLVTITIGSDGNPVYSAEGLVTLTGTNYNTGSAGLYFWLPSDTKTTLSATVAAAADNVSITKVVFWSSDNNGDYNNPLEDTAAPYLCYANSDDSKRGKSLSDDFATKVDGYRIAKVEVYGTAEITEWSLTPDADKKVWTLDKMPANNIELQVEYEPTKVTLAANDKTMGTVEVGGESKVEWTADTWNGWMSDKKENTVGDITMTSSQNASIYEYTYNTSGGKYLHSLTFFVSEREDNASVTFSTTGDPFSRIEFTMIDDYDPGEGSYHGVPNIQPADGWTFSGKSAVWEGEATKSLTLQSCSTQVSKITFFKGATPDGVTINTDGTFTVAKTATVTLKATPAEGYKFLYWEDDQTNTNPVREVTIESGMADMTYKAVFAEITYNVTFVEGTNPDPENPEWTATPNPAKTNAEVTVTYTGTKKVLGVKAEKKSVGPVTYTELKGGEVLHVGDKIQVPETDKYWYPGGETLDYRYTYEVVRVNISGSSYETTATESETGAYYALHKVGSNYYLFATGTIDDSSRLPATATSDGIAVADNGFTNGYHKYIFSVHEK
jgi:hypothetical protein